MKYDERISFNRELIDDNDIIKYFNIIHEFSKSKNIYLNFFEFTTFIMLLYFHEKQPDFIVLETGLGGRLDATNILNSFIAIITNISYSHLSLCLSSLLVKYGELIKASLTFSLSLAK
jgi:dihydrofolate synthase/folylpolyglutamate synthase